MSKNNTKIKDKKKEEFNIMVSYNKNGKSFQTIAEEILIRKMNEIEQEKKGKDGFGYYIIIFSLEAPVYSNRRT